VTHQSDTSYLRFGGPHSGPPRLAPYPKQRARNAGPLGLLGVSLLATEATGDSGDVRPIGSGHAAEIDLASGGSGGRNSVTPVELKQSAIEIVSTPANWPFRPCSLRIGHEQ
jgi:hypothetical protein